MWSRPRLSGMPWALSSRSRCPSVVMPVTHQPLYRVRTSAWPPVAGSVTSRCEGTMMVHSPACEHTALCARQRCRLSALPHLQAEPAVPGVVVVRLGVEQDAVPGIGAHRQPVDVMAEGAALRHVAAFGGGGVELEAVHFHAVYPPAAPLHRYPFGRGEPPQLTLSAERTRLSGLLPAAARGRSRNRQRNIFFMVVALDFVIKHVIDLSVCFLHVAVERLLLRAADAVEVVVRLQLYQEGARTARVVGGGGEGYLAVAHALSLLTLTVSQP